MDDKAIVASSAARREFSGQVAMVTGGARGIGAAIAEALAREGAAVIIADILSTEGESLTAKMTTGGMPAFFQQLDVTSPDDWDRALEKVEGWSGQLDVVVNAAGILIPGGVEDTRLDQFKRVMNISCDGTFLALQHCLPLLRRRSHKFPQSAVVNISSIGAFNGAPGALAYGASRAAMLSITKSAALDFAKRGYPIRVNSVHPGSVRTDLSEITYARLMAQGLSREQSVQKMTDLHPLGRLGTCEDVAQAVLFLASARASWITGASLVVDGGRIA